MHNTAEPHTDNGVPEAPATAQQQDLRVLCNHIFAPTPSRPARICGSPALRGEGFCYFHHPTRKPVGNPPERRARRIARQSFNVRTPTTPRELQLCLHEIMLRLAANQIDTRRAGLLLFALQSVAQGLCP